MPTDFVRLDDGKLELLMISRPKNIFDLENIVRSIAQKEYQNELFTLIQAQKIKIHSDIPLAYTLDGENGGEHTDVEINCLAGGIKLIKS